VRGKAKVSMSQQKSLEHTRPRWILVTIVLTQFAGTSLWFAGNAVLGDLQAAWHLAPDALGYATSAVQLGFIAGTLAFAFFAISDRVSPRIVFFACSQLGALFNIALYAFGDGLYSLIVFRCLTGFFIAGIYPVGMKIAAGWYQRGLGNALGLLVGALVLGTAFPHLLRSLGQTLPWAAVLIAVSTISALGGIAMLLLVRDGPYLARGTTFDPRSIAVIFHSREFRASCFGYFGHMWELYAFWAFVPVVLDAYAATHALSGFSVSLWTAVIIAAGFIGCAVGGKVSLRKGSARVAAAQLAASGACCVVSPILFYAPPAVFLGFLVFWGIVVVGDSPQFSALNARYAPRHLVGSALTIGNCIGFAITIGSIQLLNRLAEFAHPAWLFIALAPGPLLGLVALWPLLGAAQE
jgi:MFS family permease